VRRWVAGSTLSLAFLAIFLAALVGQALTGHSAFNHEQIAHGGDPISLARYVTSSSFAVDVMENWQSEYLQFALYIVATVWLIQRGSTESKQPGHEGPGSDPTRRRYGWWYENSLLLAMLAIFALSWAAMAVTGRVDYNAQQLDHREAALTLWQYAGTSDFWNRTLQNWQSEFLAVGSMAVLSIYLRQRGSSESKPVGAPDEQTGTEAD
jgi:uncharacterized protein DUF6766